MRLSFSPATPETLRAEARALRAERARAGVTMSHSQALEAVARQHGYRDWNTARAMLKPPHACPVQVGQAVSGRYLKQAFTGTVLGVHMLPGAGYFCLTLAFDEPVDVVGFDSFSALRRRVRCRVDARGVSPERTSDGMPHMQLMLDGPSLISTGGGAPGPAGVTMS